MSVPPTASGGATEAMFVVVVRAEFGEFMRHTGFHLFIARGQTATARGRRPTTPGPSWRPTTRPTFNAFSVSDTEGPAFQTLTKLIFLAWEARLERLRTHTADTLHPPLKMVSHVRQ